MHDDNVEEEIVDEEDDDFDDYDDDEDWDDDEEYFTLPSKSPFLMKLKSALEARKAQRKKQPKFRRQEWFRYRRLSRTGWRKPNGL